MAGVSELLIYKIAFEMIDRVTYQAKEIIFNDCECEEKVHYIEMRPVEGKGCKNFKDRLDYKFNTYEYTKLCIPGFFFILSGTVSLETPSRWLEYSLQQGDYFGENLLFNTIGVSRFGRLVASSPKVECLLLHKKLFYKLNS